MVKKALLIGINYTGQPVQLNGCINDVNNVSNVLKTKCGFATTNVLTETTKDTMMSGIQWLVSNNRPGDVLFFYYSGHGTTTKDTDGDEKDGRDEVLVPLDYKTNGVIADDWLYTNMASKVTGGVTLWGFTDCCHSGTMCDLKYNLVPNCTVRPKMPRTPYNTKNWTDVFVTSLERNAPLIGNVTFISGCQDPQVSNEVAGQGAFTRCFLAFMNQTSRFVNNTVKVSEMLKYIHCNLKINGFPSQIPQLSSSRPISLDTYFNL
jgi:hypothetical protein